MKAILVLTLTNAVLATGMFAFVAACKPRIHNPVVLHWLWILVLLKLLTPPLFSPQWALLPAVEPAAGFPADTTVSRHTNSGVASDLQFDRQIKAKPSVPFDLKDRSITRPRAVCRRTPHEQTVGVAQLRAASAHCGLS